MPGFPDHRLNATGAREARVCIGRTALEGFLSVGKGVVVVWPQVIRVVAALGLLLPVAAGAQDADVEVNFVYFGRVEEPRLPLSLLDPVIEDPGFPGARLGVEENSTTGGFLNHAYTLERVQVDPEADIVEAFSEQAEAGVRYFIVDLGKDDLLEVADSPAAQDAVLLNVRARDDDLRNDNCRANVLHIVPSRTMLADGLSQYLVWKRWDTWYLVVGRTPQDKLFAEAIRRSAKKFGARIVEEKEWTFDAGARRTDTGHVTAQQEVPAFTQGKDHDVMIVADEADLWGEYLSYRTFRPRPVAGTQGLIPTAWHRSHEQWGGTQLQRRFERLADRDMTPRDYAAWAAVRAVGEVVTRLSSADPREVRNALLSEDFKLAAFKGVPLNFRNWNGQLRQPILLAAPRMLVSVSPQKEFLHQYSQLDTLGWDKPESSCGAFE